MSFKRARSDENKQIRMEEIKQAAILLFDRLDYHEISLSRIGDEINFTRANLYKYVKSKEDIYLYILIDEIRLYWRDLLGRLDTDSPLDVKSLAQVWGETLEAHPRYIKLAAFLFPILERNASLKALVDFKESLRLRDSSLADRFRYHLPDFSESDIHELFEVTFSFVITRHYLCHLSDDLLEANRISGYDYKTPGVAASFANAAAYVINGMKLSKMVG